MSAKLVSGWYWPDAVLGRTSPYISMHSSMHAKGTLNSIGLIGVYKRKARAVVIIALLVLVVYVVRLARTTSALLQLLCGQNRAGLPCAVALPCTS